MTDTNLEVGDKVVKNPETWIPSEFDAWGAGEGVGIIVEVNRVPGEDTLVDVRWPNGRAYQRPVELRQSHEQPAESSITKLRFG